MLPDRETFEAYAAAIGSALLAFNSMEASLFGLLRAHPCRHAAIDAVEVERFSDKLKRLKRAARHESNDELRLVLVDIHAKAKVVNDMRSHLAHGLLWEDYTDGRALLRFVPYRKKVAEHWDKTPAEIRQMAKEFTDLADSMNVVAARLRSIYRLD
jgi:hypothetical protein